MARQRFIWIDGRGLVEVPADYRPPPRRFYIRGDTVEPFRSHADGKFYDSKSRYYAEVKARGLEIAGNEIQEFTRPSSEIEVGDPTPDLVQVMKEQGVLS